MQKYEIDRKLIIILSEFKKDLIQELESTHEDFSIEIEAVNEDILNQFGYLIKIYAKKRRFKFLGTVEPILLINIVLSCEVEKNQDLNLYEIMIEINNPDKTKDIGYILNKINPELINLQNIISDEFEISKKSIKIVNNVANTKDVVEKGRFVGVSLAPKEKSKLEDPKNWIILPENNKVGNSSYPKILVSTERSYSNKNWDECQKLLHKNNEFMLTIRQFIDFLSLLISGDAEYANGEKVPKEEAKRLLDEIIELRDPWRAELLDAKFSKTGDKLFITYHKIKDDGSLEEFTEELKDCLMKNKVPGIDLKCWLLNSTSCGIPKSRIPNGNLYYWHPRDGSVAVIRNEYSGLDLYLGGGPGNAFGGLGVRRAKIFRQ